MPRGMVRLRQAVLVAADLEAVAGRLRAELGLGEPFADPGVAEFGLRNAVFALGDTFLEVVSPAADGTAAGRQLERLGGDGGYMVLFEVPDQEAARARVREAGVRIVWQIDLPDISGTHLHPADTGGAIVSLDQPVPPGAWRWGGPDWQARSAPLSVAGVTIEAPDAGLTAWRWEAVLGEPAPGVEFRPGDRGLTAVRLAGWSGDAVEIGGVRFEGETT
jgi:hypothetical protein